MIGGLTRTVIAFLALVALALVWLTPLPAALPGPFSAHMAIHMTVVAVAAPLLALALAGSALDPLQGLPVTLLAVPASFVELAVVWGWHAPALHQLARHGGVAFAAEQASFLASALFVWLCAVAPTRSARGAGADFESGSTSGAGLLALLLTSMHMTLLGALLALAPRPLYPGHGMTALADQQLGGALMLTVGGVVYLIGGLALAARLLRRRGATVRAAPEGARP